MGSDVKSDWNRVKLMHSHVNPKNGEPSPLIATDVFEIVLQVLSILLKCSSVSLSPPDSRSEVFLATACGASGQ